MNQRGFPWKTGEYGWSHKAQNRSVLVALDGPFFGSPKYLRSRRSGATKQGLNDSNFCRLNIGPKPQVSKQSTFATFATWVNHGHPGPSRLRGESLSRLVPGKLLVVKKRDMYPLFPIGSMYGIYTLT